MSQNNLNLYVQEWSEGYKNKFQALHIFKPGLTKNWTQDQIQTFILQLYHFRGHFYKMLWFLGSLAPNSEYKKNIIDNIQEEFGGRSTSHEQLFFKFAEEFGVDIKAEILQPKNNPKYIQNFNNNHLHFAFNQPWSNVWSAFCAFEALDNIDYTHIHNIAKSFGTSPAGLRFFRIHMVAQHFENASKFLQPIWNENPENVKKSFEFIAENQLTMFQELDRQINSLA